MSLARTRVTGAPPWSQAWGRGSFGSAWWPGLYPWAHHPPVGRVRTVGCVVFWVAARGVGLGVLTLG